MTSILDHPLIGRRYFFPRRAPLEGAFNLDCGDARLACFHHHPHPGAKTLLHFHGNGEIVADYLGGFLECIEGIGLNCFLAEYRGYGASTGEPGLVRMLADAGAVIAGCGIPSDQLLLFGRSVGSIYAIHGASLFGDVAGLIIESGIADSLERLLMRLYPEELGCTLEELAAAVDADLCHRRKLQAYTGRTLIMHTRDDSLVDVSNAERLASWAGGPCELLIFDEGDHNDIMPVNAAAYFRALQRFAAAS